MALELGVSSSASTNHDENIHPDKGVTKLTSFRDKLAAKLAALGKTKSLKLTQAPLTATNEELILETVEVKPVVIDKATKWLAKKIHIQPVAVLPPLASPKSTRKKLPLPKFEQIKQELSEKLRVRRQEEQQQRFAIYNADNEIEDEPEEDELTSDEEKEDVEEKEITSVDSLKKKFIVNEDEELIEINENSDDGNNQDNFATDDISDDQKNDSNAEENDSNVEEDDTNAEDNEDKITSTALSRVYLSDEEDFIDKNEDLNCMHFFGESSNTNYLVDSEDDVSDMDKPPQLSPILADTSKNETNYQTEAGAPNETQILDFGFTATQLFGSLDEDPMNPDYRSPSSISNSTVEDSMKVLELDEGSCTDYLLNLCSGKFETQETYSSNMVVTNFLTDSPVDGFDNASTQFDSFEKQFALDSLNPDETADIVERAYADFNNPDLDDDRIVPNETDLDSDDDDAIKTTPTIQSRKRRVVESSDDDDENKVDHRTPLKQPKLFDSDDEDATDVEGSPASTPKSYNETPSNNYLSFTGIEGMEDVFTTKEMSPVNQERVFKELSDSELEDEEEVPTKLRVNEFLEDEASLSGDDIDEDNIDEDDLDNDYEREEGDADDIDEDEIRLQNAEHFRKKQNIEDERQLLRLKEKLFADSDLYGVGGNMDRSFRFRMRENLSNKDWLALVAKNPALIEDSDSEEEKTDEQRREAIERQKWMLNKMLKPDTNSTSFLDDIMTDSPILTLGHQALHKSGSTATSGDVRPNTTYKVSNDSLLRNSTSLAVLVKDISKSSSYSSLTKRTGTVYSGIDQL